MTVQGQRRLLELEIQRIEKCISASDAARTAIENEILEKMSNQTTTEQGTQNTLKAIMKLRKTIEATVGISCWLVRQAAETGMSLYRRRRSAQRRTKLPASRSTF